MTTNFFCVLSLNKFIFCLRNIAMHVCLLILTHTLCPVVCCGHAIHMWKKLIFVQSYQYMNSNWFIRSTFASLFLKIKCSDWHVQLMFIVHLNRKVHKARRCYYCERNRPTWKLKNNFLINMSVILGVKLATILIVYNYIEMKLTIIWTVQFIKYVFIIQYLV